MKFYRIVSVWIALCAMSWFAVTDASSPVQNKPQIGELVYAQVASAVFFLEIHNDAGKVIGSGSGFLVDPDLLITNAHVASAGHITASVGSVTLECEVVRTDEVNDLAMLRIPAKSHETPLKFADTTLQPGMVVFIGKPKGVAHTISQGLFTGYRDIDGQHLAQI